MKREPTGIFERQENKIKSGVLADNSAPTRPKDNREFDAITAPNVEARRAVRKRQTLTNDATETTDALAPSNFPNA
jgi:hypothetical protein